MPSIEKISIALPKEMVAAIRQAVDSGEYASASEVIREALRDWAHKRRLRDSGIDELRRAWQEAISDNSPSVSPEEVFTRLEQKFEARASSSGDRKECA